MHLWKKAYVVKQHSEAIANQFRKHHLGVRLISVI
jgi:hypothetical protein